MLFASAALHAHLWWAYALMALFFFWQVRALTYQRAPSQYPWWVMAAVVPHILALCLAILWLLVSIVESIKYSLGLG